MYYVLSKPVTVCQPGERPVFAVVETCILAFQPLPPFLFLSLCITFPRVALPSFFFHLESGVVISYVVYSIVQSGTQRLYFLVDTI